MSFMTAELSSQIPTVLIMLSIICVVGTVGNVLVIIVYALKHDRLTSTLFILVLAVADFLACLTLIPGTIAIEYFEWKMRSAFLCKSYYLLNNSFIPFSSLLISCIAFDRYFCLCHPFSKIMTFVRAKRIIAVLVFACLFQGGCSTFLVRIEKVQSNPTDTVDDPLTNITDRDLNWNQTSDDTYECTEVIRVNATMLEYVWYRVTQKIQIVSYVFCIISVTVLYILIYSSVSKVLKKRRQLIGRCGKSPITKIENSPQSQFEPDIVTVNRDPIRSSQLLNVGCHTPTVGRKLSGCKGTIERTNSEILTTSNHFPSYHTGVLGPVQVVLEKEAQVNEINGKSAEELLLQPSVKREPSSRNSSHMEAPKVTPNTRTPKISIQTDLSSGVLQIPTEAEGRLCLNNGERSKLSVRNLADSVTFQNLKTAAMLFVVAIVYIVAFLPAMLMANELITLYLPVFYLYYVNNAINPIVYGFMNPNFRADIKKLFSQRCRCT